MRIIVFIIITLFLVNVLFNSFISVYSFSLNTSLFETDRLNLLNYSWFKTINVQAPAVSGNNIGILSNITLILAYPGHGYVFFTALPYTELDTQISMRTAAWIASVIAGVEFDKYDYYVLMKADYPIIGGPSASGLVAVGFLSLFLNTSIKSLVTMTGMINLDGTIGPVGGLKEKIEVASTNGYKIFMIPRGQRIYRYPVVYEERFLWGVLRRVEYRTLDLVEYGKSLNITVIEVGDLLEAFSIATGFELKINETRIYIRNSVLDRVVKNKLTNLFNIIEKDLIDSRELINRISNPFDKYYLENTYKELYSKYNMLKNNCADSKQYRCIIDAMKLSSNTTDFTWFLKIYHREASVDDYIRNVNDTLNNLLFELNKSIEYIDEFNKLVLFSSAYAYFKISGFYMAIAMESYRSRDNTQVFSNIRQVHYYIKQCDLLIELLKNLESSSQRSVKIYQKLVDQIYSTALSSYSYVVTLSNEVGSFPRELDFLSALYSILVEQNHIYNIIGITPLIIGYSSASINLIFSRGSLDNTINSILKIIGRYIYLVKNLTVLEEFLLITGLEYFENKDYVNALIYLSVLNAYLQIRIINNIGVANSINLPSLSQFNYSLVNKTRSVSNPPSTLWLNNSRYLMILFYIIVGVIIISLVLVIYFVTRRI